MPSNIHSSAYIHPSSIIEKGAIIKEDCKIGPFCHITEEVILKKGNILHSNVVIQGNSNIGEYNHFYPFCTIGSTPQVENYIKSDSKLIIGDYNHFRENVTIQPGLQQFGGITKIGDYNLFMISSHIGHDCIIGNYNRFTNYVGVSGHVNIADHTIIGGFSGIQQFTQIGSYAFIAGGSMVTADIPPFCLAEGNRACLVKINTVGLSRHKFSDEQINLIKLIFRKLFLKEGLFADKLNNLLIEYQFSDIASLFLSFIQNSSRGIAPYIKRAQRKIN